MKRIAEESQTICDDHSQITAEVRALDENIKNNMRQLYNNLKREETIALVDRLNKVPEDVINIGPVLASRELSQEFFPKIKKTFQALSEDPTELNVKPVYLLLLFQHFGHLAIFDEDLQDELEASYIDLMRLCFKNDILRTSEEFIKVTAKEGGCLKFDRKIKKYFIALEHTLFARNLEIHKHIYTALDSKENSFNLYSIFASEAQLKELAAIYGKFLLADYRGDSRNTGLENRTLASIAEEIEPKEADSKPEAQE